MKEKREMELKREAFQREEEQFNEDVAEMAEEGLPDGEQEVVAFKKDRSEHRRQRKAFNVEKGKISS